MSHESKAARDQRVKAANSRWGGRGKSAQIRVDVEAAEALLEVPERSRRRVASAAVLSAARRFAKT